MAEINPIHIHPIIIATPFFAYEWILCLGNRRLKIGTIPPRKLPSAWVLFPATQPVGLKTQDADFREYDFLALKVNMLIRKNLHSSRA
jgi:hypothetical protein